MEPSKIQKQIKEDPFNPSLYQDLAEAYMDEGREDKAREVILRYRKMPNQEPAVLRRWGSLCEELGMALQAEECYQEALRLSPEDLETLCALGKLLSEVGHYERAVRVLRKALKVSADCGEAAALLAELYEAMGLTGSAAALRPPRTCEEPEEEGPRYFPPTVSEKDTDVFLRLFSGREIGYALQEVDPGLGEVRYSFRNAPLDHEILRLHILGEATVAVYPMRSDKTIRYSGVRVRLPAKMLRENLKSPGYLDYMVERARSYTIRLLRFASQNGLRAYAEDAGDYSCRLWFFFRDFVHFLKVKRFLKEFLQQIPQSEEDFLVEPLLPTRPVGVGWVEHPLTLPLGIQRSTSRRSLFLDQWGEPFPEQLKFVRKIRPLVFDQVRKAFCGRGFSERRIRMTSDGLPEELRILLARCPVLGEISQKAARGRILRREEKVALFYTVGLLDTSGEALHGLLEPCADYTYESVERQRIRLKRNPISCPKLREMMPELTASVMCNCIFDLRGGKYPSPLLHVQPHLVPSSDEFLPDKDLPIREVAKRYVRLAQHNQEVSQALRRMEFVLLSYMKKKGKDGIRVEGCMVRRCPSVEGDSLRLERG
jgi:tetratricopeptide (TPR) repeat protein